MVLQVKAMSSHHCPAGTRQWNRELHVGRTLPELNLKSGVSPVRAIAFAVRPARERTSPMATTQACGSHQ